jgi:hypothetical protein
MTTRALLGITSHGNAPYLMATRFARALGDHSIVIPHYYGDVQTTILREEIPEMSGRVYLSRELGELFRPLLLDAGNGKTFSEFGSLLARDDHPFSARSIENKFNSMLDEGLQAISLDGMEHKRFQKSDFAAVINTTLPIRANLPRSYFFFTARMSDLYGLAPDGDDSRETREAVSSLQPYAKLWAEVEATFDCEFIPRINAFSYRLQNTDPKIIHTPPFAFTRPEVNILERESFLFVPSGTRTDLRKLYQIAGTIPSEYDRLVLGSKGLNRDFPEKQFHYVGANIFGDPLLKGVIARGGWGSIWDCLANNKPIALARTMYEEDPEMGHTQKTMAALGLAAILDGAADTFLINSTREKIISAMKRERAADLKEFGNYANDGYGYIASKIHEKYDL